MNMSRVVIVIFPHYSLHDQAKANRQVRLARWHRDIPIEVYDKEVEPVL
jgi:hypothetical protein